MAAYRSYVQAIKQRIRQAQADRLAEAAQIGADAVRDSAPVRTGKLRGNVTWESQREGGQLRATIGVRRDAFYSRFLEFGTVKMPARPFFRPALQRAKDDMFRALERRWL